MVVIDEERCTGCSLCVRICHESCMTIVGGAVSIDYELCSTCTQCVAV